MMGHIMMENGFRIRDMATECSSQLPKIDMMATGLMTRNLGEARWITMMEGSMRVNGAMIWSMGKE